MKAHMEATQYHQHIRDRLMEAGFQKSQANALTLEIVKLLPRHKAPAPDHLFYDFSQTIQDYLDNSLAGNIRELKSRILANPQLLLYGHAISPVPASDLLETFSIKSLAKYKHSRASIREGILRISMQRDMGHATTEEYSPITSCLFRDDVYDIPPGTSFKDFKAEEIKPRFSYGDVYNTLAWYLLDPCKNDKDACQVGAVSAPESGPILHGALGMVNCTWDELRHACKEGEVEEIPSRLPFDKLLDYIKACLDKGIYKAPDENTLVSLATPTLSHLDPPEKPKGYICSLDEALGAFFPTGEKGPNKDPKKDANMRMRMNLLRGAVEGIPQGTNVAILGREKGVALPPLTLKNTFNSVAWHVLKKREEAKPALNGAEEHCQEDNSGEQGIELPDGRVGHGVLRSSAYTWEMIDDAMQKGEIEGIPEGTRLAEFFEIIDVRIRYDCYTLPTTESLKEALAIIRSRPGANEASMDRNAVADPPAPA